MPVAGCRESLPAGCSPAAVIWLSASLSSCRLLLCCADLRPTLASAAAAGMGLPATAAASVAAPSSVTSHPDRQRASKGQRQDVRQPAKPAAPGERTQDMQGT